MKIRIHCGTQQIGGTCIELAADGDRIILDFGLPLNGDPSDLNLAPGICSDDLRAVVISHPHIDHYGLLHHLPTETPIAIGSAARRIVQAAAPFTGQPLPSFAGPELIHTEPIQLGSFKITPFLMDHSAYDAYSLLVEAKGKRLFYSGDFRAHGRKAKLHDYLVSNPPGDIDVLLMEGSSLSRLDDDASFPSEAELEEEIFGHLKSAQGMTMFHTSSQNIDRVVTLYRACKRTGKQLIIDLYTASILAATGNSHIPQSDWPGIHLFIPKLQAIRVKMGGWFDLLKRHSAHRIYPDQFKQTARNAVLMFRPLMMKDLDEADCLENASFIYSQWTGYLKQGAYASTESWLKRHGIEMRHIHTSGHASPKDLKQFAEALAPRALVPIHSFAPDRYKALFANVVYRADGEWWDA